MSLPSDYDGYAADVSDVEQELERLDAMIAERDQQIADLRRERDPLYALRAEVRKLAAGRAFSVERTLRESVNGYTSERWSAFVFERGGCAVEADAICFESPAEVLAELRRELGHSEGDDICFAEVAK